MLERERRVPAAEPIENRPSLRNSTERRGESRPPSQESDHSRRLREECEAERRPLSCQGQSQKSPGQNPAFEVEIEKHYGRNTNGDE